MHVAKEANEQKEVAATSSTQTLRDKEIKRAENKPRTTSL